MSMYSKQYPFTNIADMMLSNPMGRSEYHPLFIDARSGESITLYHLRRLVGCLHAGLKRFGLKKGDTVCFYSPNNINMAPIYTGVMSAGMTISPANTSYVAGELQRQLEIGEAKMLIAHPSNLDIALEAAAAAGLPQSNIFSVMPDPQGRVPLWSDVLIDLNQPPLPPVKISHEESVNTVAYLCFSSGTTGKSKGVMTSHYNCIAMVQESNSYAGIFADPSVQKVILGLIPLYHFSGIHRVFNVGIPQGATVVIVEKYSIPVMCEAIQRFKVTDFPTAPPIIIHLVNNPQVDKYDLSSLKSLTVGSAPIAPSVVARFQEKFGAPLMQGYGMTEVSPVITYQLPSFAKPESIGRLAPMMKAKIVDLDGNALGINEPGELCVKGPNVMLGYKGNAEATANAIDEDGWLHTGDVVRVDEQGDYYIVDRIKELIKYKGFQVAPVELESVLMQCPYVVDAGVVGIYDETQGTEIPLAYVKLPDNLKSQANVLASKIRDWVNERVANHKRLRGGVRVIDEIPKNPSGKILRREMKAIYNKQQAAAAAASAANVERSAKL
ncbi:4-coumarate-CoA ligase 2 [Zychaea mexicana]|uniref:4-coumarate-CoA ligase 2 n=1 Tax=Zychaea mexicana TaxID=64656 RepID=UPI0022FE4BC0|nr:4-coumarate-CoA ligase 2 [Zychaea mexicana]KAI9493745.1 4-coumarate-CoA ligase 2 [Zychaea mexicana]